MRTIAALGLCMLASVGSAQTVSLDNVPPVALLSSTSTSAMSLDPVTGNVSVRSASGQLAICTTGNAPSGFDKAMQAGSTALVINNSLPIALVGAQPVAYLNRSVANGRRVLSFRVGQPLLCVDFATPPSAASNPVALQYTDPNQDTTALLFGGISVSGYFTNGAAASLLKVESGPELACCTMLPAANAACFAGGTGGAAPNLLFRNGFENSADAPPGGLADLVVNVSGPPAQTAGGIFNYTITVSNQGGNPVSGIRVRDWFPKASGGATSTLSAGSWSCAAGAGSSCGIAGGSGNIVADAVLLGANSSVTYSVSRTLSSNATVGGQFSVSAAAFAPPVVAETVLTNNQSALTVSVVAPGTSCTQTYPNTNVVSWSSVFGTWPAFGARIRISPPIQGAIAFQFTATSIPFQFGSVATFDFPGDGDGFGQLSISRSPGCFNPAELPPNCLSAVSRTGSISWSNAASQFACNLTAGVDYYVNLTYGTVNSPGQGPYCPSPPCGADMVNQVQD